MAVGIKSKDMNGRQNTFMLENLRKPNLEGISKLIVTSIFVGTRVAVTKDKINQLAAVDRTCWTCINMRKYVLLVDHVPETDK
jgi:hypothetical protein